MIVYKREEEYLPSRKTYEYIKQHPEGSFPVAPKSLVIDVKSDGLKGCNLTKLKSIPVYVPPARKWSEPYRPYHHEHNSEVFAFDDDDLLWFFFKVITIPFWVPLFVFGYLMMMLIGTLLFRGMPRNFRDIY